MPSNASTVILSTTLAVTAAYTIFQSVDTKKKLALLNEQRLSERRGRIRSEVRLRTALKQTQKEATRKEKQSTIANNNDSPKDESAPMVLTCIGRMTTPYPKRMGTPRQAQLVPHSRAYIQLTIPMEYVSGIEEYSHAWIVFSFHANTDRPGSMKTKIQPPRAPKGKKVGQLATRSPHRPNPLGLSLVRVVGVDLKLKRLMLEGVDLVSGTPIYDIKPCVPWDKPGYFDNSVMEVPPWVDQNDTLKEVTFTLTAMESLRESFNNGKFDPLYSPKDPTALQAVISTIKEVLAQDPRASKKRGSSTSLKEDPYRVLFGQVQLEFVVEKGGIVKVVGLECIDFSEFESVDGVIIKMQGVVGDDEPLIDKD